MHMNLNFHIVVATVVLTLGGCAATGDDYVVGVRPAVVDHPILGSLTIQEQDLLGPDSNQNGVRDELDKTLRATFTERDSLALGEAYAVQVTKVMIDGAAGRATTAVEIQSYVVARDCLWAVNADAVDQVRAQTTRTKNRADAMRAWAQQAGPLPTDGSVACTAGTPEAAAN